MKPEPTNPLAPPKETPVSNVDVWPTVPFWRFAVGPTDQNRPAIPFYTRDAAERFFTVVSNQCPWSRVTLYRRRWFKGVAAIKQHWPPQTLWN